MALVSLPLFFFGGIITGFDIIGGIVVLISSRKEKDSDIDQKMKKIYISSIALLISGWTLFIIIGSLYGFNVYSYFYSSITGFPGFIGLMIGFIGLYGIIIYRFRPEKLRNYLLKKKNKKK